MVGIYHSNSMKYHPERRAWQNARRLGMELKKYNKKICREAMEGQPMASFELPPFLFDRAAREPSILKYF